MICFVSENLIRQFGFRVFLYINRFKFFSVFEKINVFSVNTNLGQVSMIANDMFFQKN